ncbi:zinc-binding dehydrogenase [Nocardia jiangxiensis]|uniref:zinc-binding dehydrogenase n=1 Tax=Nocardia jiangxiensis TaxID=282685 RepID=UPI0002D672F5|nr:zinc-binding dehydrogenase [Nocardia jiangxiensis]
MKAALLHDFTGEWHVESIDIDEPVGDEVRIEVRASGLCHSDLLTATVDRGLTLPVLCGHEVAGVVTAVGPAVRTVAVGDHVTTCMAGSCEICALCLSGRPWLCAARTEGTHVLERPAGARPRLQLGDTPVTAVAAIGGFAEEVLVPERSVVGIDAAMPFDVASILGCAVITGIGAATNSARIKPGDTVAVIGCGGVGLNVVQGARLRGAARIVAVDLSAGRLARAAEFGATDLVNAGEGATVDQLKQMLPSGVDHAFEVVGTGRTLQDAVYALAPGGTAYIIGAASAPVDLSWITAQELLGGAKSIVGVYGGSARFKHDIPRYVQMYRHGVIQLDPLISDRITLNQISATYRNHDRNDSARAVLTF